MLLLLNCNMMIPPSNNFGISKPVPSNPQRLMDFTNAWEYVDKLEWTHCHIFWGCIITYLIYNSGVLPDSDNHSILGKAVAKAEMYKMAMIMAN